MACGGSSQRSTRDPFVTSTPRTGTPAFAGGQIGVVVEGDGLTYAEALSSARREAASQALGSFVMSRRTLTNDDLDERTTVLTDGFVTRIQILDQRVDERGIHRVRIWAAVADDPTSEAMLRHHGVPKPVAPDESSQKDSRASRRNAAIELLGETLARNEFPLGLLVLDPSMTRIELTDEGVLVHVDCTIRVDAARWSAFLARVGRALAALGAMDTDIAWRERPLGVRLADFRNHPTVLGRIDGAELTAYLTPRSEPCLPGPLDSVFVTVDPGSTDRTVMLAEIEPGTCRAFTLERAAFDAIAPAVNDASRVRPVLRATLVDRLGDAIADAQCSLALNVSMGVLLLAEVENGVPQRIHARRGRSADGAGFSPTRPLQLVPAIGIRDMLMREVHVRGTVAFRASPERPVASVRLDLEAAIEP